jgi:hypothetical protein
LRDENTTDSWYYDEEDNWYKKDFVLQNGYRISKPSEGNSRWKFQNKINELFVLSLDEMRYLVEDVGVPPNEAFSVQVYPDYQNENVIHPKKYIMTPFGCDTSD